MIYEERVVPYRQLIPLYLDLSPHKSLVIENAGTDTIKILRKNTFIKPQLNNPSIKTGSYLYSENYTGQIKDGFASLYSWVMLNKDFLKF